MLKKIFLISCLLWLLPVVQGAELRPYQADYVVKRGDADYGEASRVLQRAGEDQFKLYTETEISWMFLSDRRRFWSTFQWQTPHLYTLEFAYKRSGTGKNREFASTYPLTEQVLDEAAMLEQLRVDIQDASVQQWQYQVRDEQGQADQQTFARQGEETLRLPFAEVTAVKIARLREHSDRETYFWFAPSLDFVMVKMQQIEEGDEVATLLLRKLQPGD